MISIVATSEKRPQVLHAETVAGPSAGTWWQIRLIGWIYQSKNRNTTTLYFKWQVGSLGYRPAWNETLNYTVTIENQTVVNSFSLAQNQSSDFVDKSPVRSITIVHQNDGTYSGTITIEGYKCWEGFSFSDSFNLPTITPSIDSAEPTPSAATKISTDTGVPIVNTTDPRFYIYADDEVLYSMNDEDRYLVNPRLNLELNQADSLEFTLPPTNTLYSKLLRLKTTIEVRQGEEVMFRGRILDDDTDFYNNKSVHCEGALSFLGDTIMEPYEEGYYEKANELFEDAIDQHYEQVPDSTPNRRLKFVKCNVTSDVAVSNDNYSYTSDIISTLLTDIGGFMKLEYYANGETGISYLNSLEHTSSQVIDFGENLTDLTVTVDTSEIFTAVQCVGAAPKDAESGEAIGPHITSYLEDTIGIATYGKIVRYFTYDDVETQEQLDTIAYAQLLNGSTRITTIEVKAVDLHLVYPEYEKIRIGDYVRIRTAPHMIDSYFQCSKIDIDIQNPANTVYTFGATYKTLTDGTKIQHKNSAKQVSSFPEPKNVQSYFQQEVKNMRTTLSNLGRDWTNILFVTDPHSDSNKMNSQDAALYLLGNSRMSFMVLNGDFCKSGWDKDLYSAYVSKITKSKIKSKVYATVGNHDYGHADKIITDFIKGKNVTRTDSSKPYYYFDKKNKKTRFMFLNTSDSDWLTVGSEQLAWITKSVILPDSSWNLVVFAHCNFNDAGLSNITITSGADSMTARNGAAIGNAIANCNGSIIGYFCGHQHIDKGDTVTVNGKSIRQTMLLCDKFETEPYYQGYSYTRTAGQVTEQAISIISINTKTRQVVVRRIGAGSVSGLNYTY